MIQGCYAPLPQGTGVPPPPVVFVVLVLWCWWFTHPLPCGPCSSGGILGGRGIVDDLASYSILLLMLLPYSFNDVSQLATRIFGGSWDVVPAYNSTLVEL